MNKNILIPLLAVAIIAGSSGFFAYQWLFANKPEISKKPDNASEKSSSNQTTETEKITVHSIKNGDKPIRPAFSIKDFDDRVRHIKEWDGKIIILNFWASWCPPCKKEMPALIELQEKYGKQGLQIIGVAIDQKNMAQDFADSIGVNYVMLYGELDAVDINQRYGNQRGQLPYTIIINRQQQIVGVKRGEITKAEAENAIKALLQQ